MMTTYQIETTFAVKYTTENPVPISEIVRSLKSMEQVLLRSGHFIEKAYPGIVVLETKVFVKEVQAGSLFNNFAIQYILGGEENAKKAEELIKKIQQDSQPVKTIVAIGVGATMMYGLLQVLPKGEPVKAIEAHNSVIIQAGGDVNLTPESVTEVLEAMKDKRKLSKDVVGALHPAKHDASPIELGGLSALTIPTDVIHAAPEEYKPPVPEEKDERYKNVPLLISASDRDNPDKGWAGVAIGVHDSRLKIFLSSNVDPKNLHGKTRVNADITITSKYQSGRKQHLPVLITVERIY